MNNNTTSINVIINGWKRSMLNKKDKLNETQITQLLVLLEVSCCTLSCELKSCVLLCWVREEYY